jgi:hypothetical protein
VRRKKRISRKSAAELWTDTIQPALENWLSSRSKADQSTLRVDATARLTRARHKKARHKPAADTYRAGYHLLLNLNGELDLYPLSSSRPTDVPLPAIVFGHRKCEMRFFPAQDLDGRFVVSYCCSTSTPDLKASLNRSNRQLWNCSENRPGREYRTIEYAEDVWQRLRCAWETAQTTDKRQILPSAYEIDVALRDLLDCINDCTKLHLASRLYREHNCKDNEGDISPLADGRYRNEALLLALKLQRPPTMAELRKQIGWSKLSAPRAKAPWRLSDFKKEITRAGLGWLPTNFLLRRALTKQS